MEVLNHQSTPILEDKTLDETTVFFSENGSVSKKRRRKSLGRRVSFAEAPKLHIFPRDDEYVTPTRATNSGISPSRAGAERRSPRLAAKVVDADKENRISASNRASHRGRRAGGSKPLAVRGEENSALKPHNWLDARDSSQAGDDENTGPVDLRHLSFDQKETETDDENITLDGTTFALKSLQQIRSGELAAVVQIDKNRLATVSADEDGSPDEEDVLRDAQDMTFTMNRPLLLPKSVGESTTGFESISSDTIMSITMQVPRREKMLHMLDGDDNIIVQLGEDAMTVFPQKIPSPRRFLLDGSRDDKPAVALNSNCVQNGAAPVLRAQDGRAQIEERFGGLDDDTSPVDGSFQDAVKSSLQGIRIPTAEGLPARLEEQFGDDTPMQLEDDSMTLIPQQEKFSMSGSRDNNAALVLSSQDLHNCPAPISRAQDVQALFEERFGDLGEDTSPVQRNFQGAFKSPLQDIQSPKDEDPPTRLEEQFRDDIQMEVEDDSLTVSPQKIPPRKNFILPLEEKFGGPGDDIHAQMEEDLMAVKPQKMPPPRKLILHGGRDDNSAVARGSHGLQNDLAPVPRGEDVRALIEERFGDLGDLGDDTRRAQRNYQGERKSPLHGMIITRIGDLRVPSEVIVVSGGEASKLPLKGVDLVDLDEDTNLTRGSEENPDPTGTVEMSLSSPRFMAPMGNEDRSITMAIPTLRQLLRVEEDEDDEMSSSRGQENGTITMSIPSLRNLIREDEEDGEMMVEDEDMPTASRSMWMTPPSPVVNRKAKDDFSPGRDDDNYDTAAPTAEGIRGDAEEIMTDTKMSVEEEDVPHRTFKSGDTTALTTDRIVEDERESISVTKVSVEDEDVPTLTFKSGDTTALITDRIPEKKEESISVTKVSVEDEHVPPLDFKSGDTTALITDRIPEDEEERISITKVAVEEEDVPHLTIKRGDAIDRITDRIPEDEEEKRISVTKMSVDEFLQRAEVQFSLGLQSPREILKDPSLAEIHQVRSLSESLHFVCVVKPQVNVMHDACEELYEDNDIKSTAIAKLEQPLTEIFSYFQNAPEWEKQRIRKQLKRIHGNCRLLAESNRLHFQLIVEQDKSSTLLEMKNSMKMNFMEHIQEQRDIFEEKCYQPFLRLQARLSSRDAHPECISTSQSQLPTVKQLRTTVNLERIEDLKKRLENLKSSMELKSGKSRPREQTAEETLRGLKQRIGRGKSNLSNLRSQLVETLCSGKNNRQKEEVAHSPYLDVWKMKSEVCLVHKLQDGFKVKSAGRENQDMVVELSYRSLVKRRYVVRKIGTAVKVLRSTWSLESENIEEVFPKMNALVVFAFVLQQSGTSKATATNSTAWTQKFGRLTASEAIRFTLPSDKLDAIPEPTNLRESMQFTRILLGNLMDFMAEIGKCQPAVNASSGGGILAEPRFRNEPDGQLHLELKFIDCISSIKFYVYLDMTCLPMNGYPLGDLPAKVEIAYCAPPFRQWFKRETLEQVISLVKPGYRRLERTYAAVGSFLASLRRSGST